MQFQSFKIIQDSKKVNMRRFFIGLVYKPRLVKLQ